MNNKIFILVDFGQKNFGRNLAKYRKIWPNFFFSKSTKMKILLCKVCMRIKLLKSFFFIYVVKNLSFCSKFTLEKEVLWFLSNGLLFRIFFILDYWTTYLQVSESAFRYSGGFFCVRSYSHQVVMDLAPFWVDFPPTSYDAQWTAPKIEKW